MSTDTTPPTLYADRAKELMTLAMGVGITNEQSARMIAEKLCEWDQAEYTGDLAAVSADLEAVCEAAGHSQFSSAPLSATIALLKEEHAQMSDAISAAREALAENDGPFLCDAISHIKREREALRVEVGVLREDKADLDWLQRDPQARFVRAVSTWMKPGAVAAGVITIRDAIRAERKADNV